MKTLDRLRTDWRVEHVDKEDDGVIVTLKQGWTWDPLQDNRVRGEDTATEILRAMRSVLTFDGPYTS